MTHAWQTPELTQRFLTKTRAALPLSAEQLDVMLFIIRRARQSVTRILDVGSGNGLLSQVLLARYPAAHTTLVDFSEPMLNAARAQFTPQQATIIHYDLTDPQWVQQVPAPFDVIVSGYAIHHLTHERKRALYREIYDLLAPDGIFLNVEHVASPTEWVEDLFNTSFAEALYAQDQSVPLDELLYKMKHQEDGDICATVEEQCAWLRDIGFQHVDCYMKIYALAVFGGRKLV